VKVTQSRLPDATFSAGWGGVIPPCADCYLYNGRYK